MQGLIWVDGQVQGFLRGGAWAAAVVVLMTFANLAPIVLR